MIRTHALASTTYIARVPNAACLAPIDLRSTKLLAPSSTRIGNRIDIFLKTHALQRLRWSQARAEPHGFFLIGPESGAIARAGRAAAAIELLVPPAPAQKLVDSRVVTLAPP